MNFLAKLISIIFHPTLMATYGVVTIFQTGAEYPYLDIKHQLYLILFVFVVTFLIPVSMLPVYLGMGVIRSVYMEHHRERAIPLVISSLAFLMGYFLLMRVFPENFLLNVMLLSGLAVLLTGIVSFFWKISAHLIGLGGWFALTIFAGYYLQANTSAWVALAALGAGATAFARLYLGAHNVAQVIVGFASGAVLCGFGLWILM